MPTEPIAISTTPPNPSHPTLAPNPNTTPSSDLSISPQTPFLPQPGMSPSSATPTPTISQGFFKWAASTLPKSPPVQQRGFDLPAVTVADHETDLEHESHDSFEYGDFSDLKLRPWGGGRRAVSMSMPSGQGASGIGSMLKGFGESPNPAQSPPAAGVMADKYSKGQGVLRRLSFSGANYRPNILSPPAQNSAVFSPPLTASPSVPEPLPAPAEVGPPQADAPVQRAVTLGRGRRRYSENGARRRGVSPMGERILREHGHF